MFLNIMFHAQMGKFQLESKLELPLFLGLTIVLFIEIMAINDIKNIQALSLDTAMKLFRAKILQR